MDDFRFSPITSNEKFNEFLRKKVPT